MGKGGDAELIKTCESGEGTGMGMWMLQYAQGHGPFCFTLLSLVVHMGSTTNALQGVTVLLSCTKYLGSRKGHVVLST